VENYVPSLREVVEAEKLDPQCLSVAFHSDDQSRISIKDRHDIWVYDGERGAMWRAPTLQELFRGNRQPPAPSEMERYPEDYVSAFYFIERHLLTICAAQGDRTDAELEHLYSNLRRRPDGKSIGPEHDALWQVVALLLAMRPLSQAEFEAIFSQLARSVRRWKIGDTSRNYVAFLYRELDEDAD
jgi:hypothetical protein